MNSYIIILFTSIYIIINAFKYNNNLILDYVL